MEKLYHAYLLVGDSDSAEAFLRSLAKKLDIKLWGSPDFFVWNEELFGIDEARELSGSASRKAFTGRKIFLISPQKITPEAQNALLKTFEDPYENTHFFLVTREEELILPTLRSRMQVEKLEATERDSLEAKKFLNLPYKERLVFARKFADREENLSIFLDELLSLLREKGESPEKVKHVYEARRYSDDRSPSPRLILEHLALCL